MARNIVEIKGLDAFKKGLSDLQLEQYPYAMKEALNEMSAIVQKGEKQRMSQDFDRPTPFTLNALRINYATKSNLSGGVVFKDPPRLSESQHYIYPNVFGVKRGFKKFEAALYARGLMPAGYYAVPGKSVQLDAFGNVPSSLVIQVLSWFGANTNAGYTSATSDATKAKRKRGTKKKYGFEYFSLRKKTGNLLPGIYKRTYTPFVDPETGKLLPSSISSVFIFVQKQYVGYQRPFKFHETGKTIFNQYFKQTFGERLEFAMKTALKK